MAHGDDWDWASVLERLGPSIEPVDCGYTGEAIPAARWPVYCVLTGLTGGKDDFPGTGGFPPGLFIGAGADVESWELGLMAPACEYTLSGNSNGR